MQSAEVGESKPFQHITVLLREVVAAVERAASLCTSEPLWVVDCTLGGGGHSEAILQALPLVHVLGLDRDPAALQAASERLAPFGERFVCEHADFAQLQQVCERRQLPPLLAVVADLGVSSHQFDRAERGFSLRLDGPLDMRMDPSRGPTALDLLGDIKLEDLADVLYAYGDIQRSIGTARILLEEVHAGAVTTGKLADRLAARLGRTRSIHPATQVFQALRVWVNGELDQIEALLQQAPGLLAPGGALAVISFQSGEDRPVKRAMAELGKRGGDFWLPQRKPVLPGEQEQQQNSRSRSAKLRVMHKKTLDETVPEQPDNDSEDDADES
jgi:16S rRNA (cytosine1402-N4)-methyltransferase